MSNNGKRQKNANKESIIEKVKKFREKFIGIIPNKDKVINFENQEEKEIIIQLYDSIVNIYKLLCPFNVDFDTKDTLLKIYNVKRVDIKNIIMYVIEELSKGDLNKDNLLIQLFQVAGFYMQITHINQEIKEDNQDASKEATNFLNNLFKFEYKDEESFFNAWLNQIHTNIINHMKQKDMLKTRNLYNENNPNTAKEKIKQLHTHLIYYEKAKKELNQISGKLGKLAIKNSQKNQVSIGKTPKTNEELIKKLNISIGNIIQIEPSAITPDKVLELLQKIPSIINFIDGINLIEYYNVSKGGKIDTSNTKTGLISEKIGMSLGSKLYSTNLKIRKQLMTKNTLNSKGKVKKKWSDKSKSEKILTGIRKPFEATTDLVKVSSKGVGFLIIGSLGAVSSLLEGSLKIIFAIIGTVVSPFIPQELIKQFVGKSKQEIETIIKSWSYKVKKEKEGLMEFSENYKKFIKKDNNKITPYAIHYYLNAYKLLLEFFNKVKKTYEGNDDISKTIERLENIIYNNIKSKLTRANKFTIYNMKELFEDDKYIKNKEKTLYEFDVSNIMNDIYNEQSGDNKIMSGGSSGLMFSSIKHNRVQRLLNHIYNNLPANLQLDFVKEYNELINKSSTTPIIEFINLASNYINYSLNSDKSISSLYETQFRELFGNYVYMYYTFKIFIPLYVILTLLSYKSSIEGDILELNKKYQLIMKTINNNLNLGIENYTKILKSNNKLLETLTNISKVNNKYDTMKKNITEYKNKVSAALKSEGIVDDYKALLYINGYEFSSGTDESGSGSFDSLLNKIFEVGSLVLDYNDTDYDGAGVAPPKKGIYNLYIKMSSNIKDYYNNKLDTEVEEGDTLQNNMYPIFNKYYNNNENSFPLLSINYSYNKDEDLSKYKGMLSSILNNQKFTVDNLYKQHIIYKLLYIHTGAFDIAVLTSGYPEAEYNIKFVEHVIKVKNGDLKLIKIKSTLTNEEYITNMLNGTQNTRTITGEDKYNDVNAQYHSTRYELVNNFTNIADQIYRLSLINKDNNNILNKNISQTINDDPTIKTELLKKKVSDPDVQGNIGDFNEVSKNIYISYISMFKEVDKLNHEVGQIISEKKLPIDKILLNLSMFMLIGLVILALIKKMAITQEAYKEYVKTNNIYILFDLVENIIPERKTKNLIEIYKSKEKEDEDIIKELNRSFYITGFDYKKADFDIEKVQKNLKSMKETLDLKYSISDKTSYKLKAKELKAISHRVFSLDKDMDEIYIDIIGTIFIIMFFTYFIYVTVSLMSS